jgi:hypothetical protein
MSIVSIDQTVMPHRRELCFAGAACNLSTTSVELAKVLEDLSVTTGNVGGSRFSMRVVVDELMTGPAESPHFRGLHHIVIASFGGSNIFVFDVLRRGLSARVSASVARDLQFWKQKLIPIALGVLGSAMGLVPVHCACLESEGDGLLIAGNSGAGKSTLSTALSQNGFNYVSDDWTYMSEHRDTLVAYGTSAPVKLLPDAVQHFRNLSSYSVHTSMNGELAYEVDMGSVFGAHVVPSCEPRWLIFLERMEKPGCEFVRLSSADTRSYLESSIETLPMQLAEANERRSQVLENISALPCWSFRYGGTPQFATEQLREFVVSRKLEEVYA